MNNIILWLQDFWMWFKSELLCMLFPKTPEHLEVVTVRLHPELSWNSSVGHLSGSCWDLSPNKFICVLPVLSAQCSTPVDEGTGSIIHLLRRVIKHCHSLPKLGLIIPAVQAVVPASCSSPLTDQDIHPTERHTYWSDCSSQHCTRTLSKAPPCWFLHWKNTCFLPLTHNLRIQYVSLLFQHPHMVTLSV